MAASAATVVKSLPDDDVDRLRRHRLHDRLDVGEAANAGRVKAIGSRLGVGGQPADRLREIRAGRR